MHTNQPSHRSKITADNRRSISQSSGSRYSPQSSHTALDLVSRTDGAMNADGIDDIVRKRLVIDERILTRLAKRAVDIGGLHSPPATDDTAAPVANASTQTDLSKELQDFRADTHAFRHSLRRLSLQLAAQHTDLSSLTAQHDALLAQQTSAEAEVSDLRSTLATERRLRSSRRKFDAATRELLRSNLPSRSDGERSLKALRSEIKGLKLQKGNLQRAWTRRQRLFEPVYEALKAYGTESVKEVSTAPAVAAEAAAADEEDGDGGDGSDGDREDDGKDDNDDDDAAGGTDAAQDRGSDGKVPGSGVDGEGATDGGARSDAIMSDPAAAGLPVETRNAGDSGQVEAGRDVEMAEA